MGDVVFARVFEQPAQQGAQNAIILQEGPGGRVVVAGTCSYKFLRSCQDYIVAEHLSKRLRHLPRFLRRR